MLAAAASLVSNSIFIAIAIAVVVAFAVVVTLAVVVAVSVIVLRIVCSGQSTLIIKFIFPINSFTIYFMEIVDWNGSINIPNCCYTRNARNARKVTRSAVYPRTGG